MADVSRDIPSCEVRKLLRAYRARGTQQKERTGEGPSHKKFGFHRTFARKSLTNSPVENLVGAKRRRLQ